MAATGKKLKTILAKSDFRKIYKRRQLVSMLTTQYLLFTFKIMQRLVKTKQQKNLFDPTNYIILSIK